MTLFPISISIEESNGILPEIKCILEQMIDMYNTWTGGPEYLKLDSCRVGLGESPTSARYSKFDSRESLFWAIIKNCPENMHLKYKIDE